MGNKVKEKNPFLLFLTNSQRSSPTNPLESQLGGIRVGARTKGTPVGGLRQPLADHPCICAGPKVGGASAAPCLRIPLWFPFWSRWFW